MLRLDKLFFPINFYCTLYVFLQWFITIIIKATIVRLSVEICRGGKYRILIYLIINYLLIIGVGTNKICTRGLIINNVYY